MTRRRARRFAAWVDALRQLVRRVRMRPIKRRPTTWLNEPPRLVRPPSWDADESESTTRGYEAAWAPDAPLEPTGGDARFHAVGYDPSHPREINRERRPRAGDALRERDRWDERDNIITCTVDAAPSQPRPPRDRPPRDRATGSAPCDRQASPGSRITEARFDPATWIAVGLGAPTYSPRDPRLCVAASAAGVEPLRAPTPPHGGMRPAAPDCVAFDLPPSQPRAAQPPNSASDLP